jgi:ATP-dependent helicase/nuclease subunit A
MNDVSESPLDWTTAQQRRASDPRASAWVSANAGSGKTHVLSQRVIRLLLDGARPSAVLCLTYTKAAAAEMANRVFERLAQWTRLDDPALTKALYEIDGRTPAPERLTRARQLFALALETPGGLKIQTIHAFCEAVLHQFPLEANVAGHFSVMDDGETATLIAEARRQLLTDVSIRDDEALAGAFATVLDAAGEFGLEALLDDLVANRGAIARFTDEAGRHGGVRLVLLAAAGFPPDATEESVKAAVWPLPSMPESMIESYAEAANAGSAKKPAGYAKALGTAMHAQTADERWAHLLQLCLREDGEPRTGLVHAGAGKITDVLPEIQDHMNAVFEHVLGTLDRLKTLRMIEMTVGALMLAQRLHADYKRLKRRRGQLDFDDLVELTGDLLRRKGAGAWVHYKLDQGIDHILVDEAQDTSPAQWSIIRHLSDEFFAGQGSNRTLRTLFSVGDEKQSIYSFQGARPERFRAEGRDVERRAGAMGTRFEGVGLKLSFRSAADVLKAVDRVFDVAENRRGLGEPGQTIEHESARGHEPGLVDLWEMIGKEKRAEDEDWTAPFDDTPESDPKAQLARRVAATIRQWIAGETLVVKGKRRPITAGDILVLVRKRDGFVNALMRELKQAPAVAVAGADRLVLTDHIAVKDLMALGSAVALPGDDLSLAALMKSPLFELDEDDLYRLCRERPETMSVADHLTVLAAAGQTPFAEAHAKLVAFREDAARGSVHDFYAHVLGPRGGRAEILARLGSEAADILDEFLAFALDHERAGLPGLRSFLAVLEEQSPTIKRELEQDRDEVRIMTVHASKGLEAPVVFLVDSGGKAALSQHIPKLREWEIGRLASPGILWVPGKAYENTLSTALKNELAAAAEEEYRRLLYVAMTRAADRLVICGYHGFDTPRYEHWFSMVQGALCQEKEGQASAEPKSFEAGGMSWQGWRFQPGDHRRAFPPLERIGRDEQPATAIRAPLSPLPPPARPPRPLMPSGAHAVLDDERPEAVAGSPFAATAGGRTAGLMRGRVVHRFMQVLPGLDPPERETAARRYLARAVPDWPDDEVEVVVASVMRIFGDPAFAPVFSAGSEAEVSVMGSVMLGNREHVVSGRIDRLAVGETHVLILDYKTDRPPAVTADAVSVTYRAQMALYRALIAPLYPGKTVEAALLFTEAPALIRLDGAALDAALAGITTK